MATTMHTMKLVAIPASLSSSSFIFRPISKTLRLGLIFRHNYSQKLPFPFLARALSSPALQIAETTDSKGEHRSYYHDLFDF